MAIVPEVSEINSVDQSTVLLPKLNPWIVLKDLGDGQYVVKNTQNSSYFSTGPFEFFLLQKLQEGIAKSQLCSDYQERFGEELNDADLDDFLSSIARNKLISSQDALAPTERSIQANENDADDEEASGQKPLLKQSILFWRLPLVNPDRFLGYLARTFPWVWSKGFLYASLVLMVLAAIVLLQSGVEVRRSFENSLRWESLVILGLASIGATALHEIAHGATCKRFGGEVKEAGLLFLMFIPCLYVNVSDAWTIPGRRKRLLITAAGGYMDLCVWSLCVFVWRVTVPESFVNYLAFMVMSTCGARGAMNFNPFLRFDGYYLLSDLLAIPNLYSRGRRYLFAHLSWLLWGAPRPQKVDNARVVFIYGLVSWLFGVAFLNIVLIAMLRYIKLEFGITGFLFGCLLMFVALQRVFKGFLDKEFVKMIQFRSTRRLMWVLGVVGGIALLFVIPTRHNVNGEFEVRPLDCIDIPSPIGCFIGNVNVQDGQEVNEGDIICELRSPELLSQLESKQAELIESEAMVKRLKAGPRPEELSEQESRVSRLKRWCELGKVEVETMKSSLKHQLEAVENRIKQAEAELEYAQKVIEQSEQLAGQGALAPTQLERERTKGDVLQRRLDEVKAEKAVLETEGIREAIAELARREQELADAESKLRLLKLGNRIEDIQAEEARLKRLTEEFEFLTEQKKALQVVATKRGNVRAARLRERVGSYVAKGELLCQIETSGSPLIEVLINEQDALAVQPGQKVVFKARALPLEVLEGHVERVAASALTTSKSGFTSSNSQQGQKVILYCQVDKGFERLKSGMTGFARVSRGWTSIGRMLQLQAYRYLRTEFWW